MELIDIALLITILIVGLMLFSIMDDATKVNNYCKDKGFEEGQYYSDAEGTFCWDNIEKLTSSGDRYKSKENMTFFADKRSSHSGESDDK